MGNFLNNFKFGFFVFVCIIIIGREGKLKWLWVGKIFVKRKIWIVKIILYWYKSIICWYCECFYFGKFNLFFILLKELLFIFFLMYLCFFDYWLLGNVFVYYLFFGFGIGVWNENIDIVVYFYLSIVLIFI